MCVVVARLTVLQSGELDNCRRGIRQANWRGGIQETLMINSAAEKSYLL